MNSCDVSPLASVVYRFFRALDTRDHAEVSRLMASQGTWVRQGVSLVGPDAVMLALDRRDPERRTAHVVSNLWVESSTATTARVRFYMTAFETRADQMVPQMLGVRDSVDDLVLENGAWHIWRKESRQILPAK